MVTSRSMALGTDSHFHPTKTPGHLKGRGENAILGGISIHGKTTRPTRPLGDKTPFPNRVPGRQFHTPIPHAKFPVLTFLDTPQETVLQDDYDEIEYMPPNTADLLYQPPFDFEMPNYKEVGKALQKLAYSHPFDDTPPVEISINEDEITPAIWDMLTLPEVEDDDPFQQARAAVSNPSKGSSLNHRAVSGRYQGDVPTRPALTRTASTTHKPPSATSTKPTAPSHPRNASASPSVPASTSTTTKATIPPKTTRSRQTTAAPRKPLSSVTAAPLSQKPASSGVPSRPRTGTVKSPPATTTTTTTTPTSTIPPRPSTSAAVRTRVTSTGVTGTKTAASLKRPSTSASSYRTTTMATKKAGRGAGGGVVGRGGVVRGKRVPLGAMNARTSADDMVLEVHAGEIEVDEFRFDV